MIDFGHVALPSLEAFSSPRPSDEAFVVVLCGEQGNRWKDLHLQEGLG